MALMKGDIYKGQMAHVPSTAVRWIECSWKEALLSGSAVAGRQHELYMSVLSQRLYCYYTPVYAGFSLVFPMALLGYHVMQLGDSRKMRGFSHMILPNFRALSCTRLSTIEL